MSFFNPLPQNLTMRMPLVWCATFFGMGRLPYAPGSWGSLLALIIIAPFHALYGVEAILVFMAICVPLGLWSASRFAAHARYSDPRAVVIDEAAGQGLALLLAAPADLSDYLWAFILFRLFDILKPWPVSLMERRLPGAWGIMGDDLGAALYALLAIFLLKLGGVA